MVVVLLLLLAVLLKLPAAADGAGGAAAGGVLRVKPAAASPVHIQASKQAQRRCHRGPM